MELPARSGKGSFNVVVESPRGSQVKLKYDAELRALKFSRPLPAGLRYPHDWGFVPSTVGLDGDPIDAMVLSDLPTYPGVVIECRAVGVIRLSQNRKKAAGRERNDRLIAVPLKMRRFDLLHKPTDLPLRWRQELEEFFVAATRFQQKDVELLGWGSAAEGERMVDRCVPGSRHCMGTKMKRAELGA